LARPQFACRPDLRGARQALAAKHVRRPTNQIAGYRNPITQCRESTFLNILGPDDRRRIEWRFHEKPIDLKALGLGFAFSRRTGTPIPQLKP
jgi:hypothetical protein